MFNYSFSDLKRTCGIVAVLCGIVLSAAEPACAGITTETISFHSDALDAQTTYIVALPSPIKPDHRYPVLYLLHGATGSYLDWTEKTTFTELLDGRDMIVVTPDGGEFGWYLDSKIKPESQYDSAISRDLIADVEKRFPVRTDRGGRGIAGLSMGGHGAITLAAKHPDLYGSASSMSGILDIVPHPKSWHLPDILGDQPEALPEWKRNSAYYLADVFTTANVALLFDTGTEDQTGAVSDSRQLHKRFEELGVQHTYREFPGIHNWNYWSAHIREHLDFHEKHFESDASADTDQFDVVVYGATPAGIAAAVAAGRLGQNVALVEPLPIAGGMMSGGLSFSDSNQTARETLGGIFEEFHLRVEKYYTDRGTSLPYSVKVKDNKPWTYEPHVAEKIFHEMLNEAHVGIFLNERLTEADVENNRISAIDTATGKHFHGKVFVDATYEGDLMAAAGVSYRVGRESRDEFDEPLAGVRFPKKPVTNVDVMDDDGKPLPLITTTEMPEEGSGDNRIMAYSFRFCFSRDPDNQVPITKPEGYDPINYELLGRYLEANPDVRKVFDLYKIPGNKLDGNNAMTMQISLGMVEGALGYPEGTPQEREAILQNHRAYSEGLFYFLKTDKRVPKHIRERMNRIGYAKDEFKNNGNFPPVFYVREARRMEGAYFLTQHDIETSNTKPDSIGVGSFPIDSHDCQRIALKDGGFLDEGTIYPYRMKTRKIGYPYEMPYRAITPKESECENLLVPVCLSASHVALSSVRVEPTWMVLGQAAGVAASIAAEDSKPVQEVPYGRLSEQLKAQGQILDVGAVKK